VEHLAAGELEGGTQSQRGAASEGVRHCSGTGLGGGGGGGREGGGEKEAGRESEAADGDGLGGDPELAGFIYARGEQGGDEAFAAGGLQAGPEEELVVLKAEGEVADFGGPAADMAGGDGPLGHLCVEPGLGIIGRDKGGEAARGVRGPGRGGSCGRIAAVHERDGTVL